MNYNFSHRSVNFKKINKEELTIFLENKTKNANWLFQMEGHRSKHSNKLKNKKINTNQLNFVILERYQMMKTIHIQTLTRQVCFDGVTRLVSSVCLLQSKKKLTWKSKKKSNWIVFLLIDLNDWEFKNLKYYRIQYFIVILQFYSKNFYWFLLNLIVFLNCI